MTQGALAAAPVLLESVHDGVALLVMNRPERMNALNNELATSLYNSLEKISQDDLIRVVVLTGAGRAFCAGGDLAVIGKGREENNSKQLEPILRAGMAAVLKIRTKPQPVIPAGDGPAAGPGLELGAPADIPTRAGGGPVRP